MLLLFTTFQKKFKGKFGSFHDTYPGVYRVDERMFDTRVDTKVKLNNDDYFVVKFNLICYYYFGPVKYVIVRLC